MGFNDFLGNAPIVETIRRQLTGQRLPNSLLFAGTQGIGKWTLAHFLSKALNCHNLEYDFCGYCSSCRKIEAKSHLDIKNYTPDGQFIKIDPMRELRREVFFRPSEGKRRVFIIDQAERLNEEAGNCILKTLEEPPESSVLILVTAKPNELLPTIRSRCQHYRFARLPSEEIEGLLASRTQHTPEDRRLLSRISEGSLGIALNLDLGDHRLQRQEMISLLENCSRKFLYSGAARYINLLVDKRSSDQFEGKMKILYGLLRDLHLLKIDPDMQSIMNVDIRSKLLALCPFFSFARIVEGARSLDHIESGARRNLNRNLAVDQLVLRLSGAVD